MKIDILSNNEIIIDSRKGYFIIKQEGKGFGIYHKFENDDLLYRLHGYDNIFNALNYVKNFEFLTDD